MTYLLLLFNEINSDIYFNFSDLRFYCQNQTKDVKKVLDFLDELSNLYSYEDIKLYYFDKYFSFVAQNGYTKILNLTQFLNFAVNDFNGFVEDITSELSQY